MSMPAQHLWKVQILNPDQTAGMWQAVESQVISHLLLVDTFIIVFSCFYCYEPGEIVSVTVKFQECCLKDPLLCLSSA